MKQEKVVIFWFRRDLRLNDNCGLFHALNTSHRVLPIFIFDHDILQELASDDRRVSFIFDALMAINDKLLKHGSRLHVFEGTPVGVFAELIEQYDVQEVFANEDYEDYAVRRDKALASFLQKSGISLRLFSDQLLLRPGTVLSASGKPYTVFTPFSKAWRKTLSDTGIEVYASEAKLDRCFRSEPAVFTMPKGFEKRSYKVQKAEIDVGVIRRYEERRNFPAADAGSGLGVHLRFGTISIRRAWLQGAALSDAWGNELIWREFFMHVLFHFPHVTRQSFRREYDAIAWRNNEQDFGRWCRGETGFPLVDAGIRQLLVTGTMHNRVRMVVAGFLCKDLLIDWRWGEAFFASHLLDYELSSNNGNWQWAAGTGCDAAPYFRIFNPSEQQKKFDPDFDYISQWLPEFDKPYYPAPMVDHAMARVRCLAAYRSVKTI